jgi:hypothetical protein
MPNGSDQRLATKRSSTPQDSIASPLEREVMPFVLIGVRTI